MSKKSKGVSIEVASALVKDVTVRIFRPLAEEDHVVNLKLVLVKHRVDRPLVRGHRVTACRSIVKTATVSSVLVLSSSKLVLAKAAALSWVSYSAWRTER